MTLARLGPMMQCHYCDRSAVYAAESDGIRVGLCEKHLRERVAELSESDRLVDLREELES